MLNKLIRILKNIGWQTLSRREAPNFILLALLWLSFRKGIIAIISQSLKRLAFRKIITASIFESIVASISEKYKGWHFGKI